VQKATKHVLVEAAIKSKELQGELKSPTKCMRTLVLGGFKNPKRPLSP